MRIYIITSSQHIICLDSFYIRELCSIYIYSESENESGRVPLVADLFLFYLIDEKNNERKQR